MRHLTTCVLMLALLTAPLSISLATASDIKLPVVLIEDRGELLVTGEELTFRPWSSDLSHGKVHVLQYIPATRAGRDIYKQFTDTLQAQLQPGSYHVSTILNLDEALWGTRGLVMSEMTKNKRKYPKATMVIDADGLLRERWQLNGKGSAIAILDGDGGILFFKEGKMSDDEMADMYELVRSRVTESA